MGIDITGATTHDLIVRKPDGVVAEWTATITDAVNGVMQYVTSTGDLNITGEYLLHAKVVLAGGTHTGSVVKFLVASLFSPVCESDLDNDYCS